MVSLTPTKRTLLFGAYCLVLALCNVRVLSALTDYSRANASSSHVLLIPLVSLVLIYQNRRAIFADIRSSRGGGAIVVLGGGALLSVGLLRDPVAAPDTWLALRVGGLILLFIGGFVLSYGLSAARAAAFPLVFLAFTVPFPAPLLDAAVSFLKNASTEAVALLFTVTGTPFHRNGFMFSLPGLAIEVADACSGIRSSIALVLTALLAGHLFLRKGWTKATLVVAVVPVAIIKNAVRIVALSLLAIHVDSGFITGRLHHEGGIVFFLLSLTIVAAIFAVLRYSEHERAMEG